LEIVLIIILSVVGFTVFDIHKKLDNIERRIDEAEENLAEEIRDNGINQNEDDDPNGVLD